MDPSKTSNSDLTRILIVILAAVILNFLVYLLTSVDCIWQQGSSQAPIPAAMKHIQRDMEKGDEPPLDKVSPSVEIQVNTDVEVGSADVNGMVALTDSGNLETRLGSRRKSAVIDNIRKTSKWFPSFSGFSGFFKFSKTSKRGNVKT